jgi:hypothetical protein
MIKSDEIELHDALIENISTDFATGSVRIDVAYYTTPDSRQRSRAAFVFEDVESISQISNVARIRQNSFAGNVNYWVPARTAGQPISTWPTVA